MPALSLARLPGLATNRDRDNGTQISIRGLGPLSLKGDVVYETGADILKSIQLGVRHTGRTKDYPQRTQFGFIDPAARTTIPAGLLNDPVRFTGGFGDVLELIAGLPN